MSNLNSAAQTPRTLNFSPFQSPSSLLKPQSTKNSAHTPGSKFGSNLTPIEGFDRLKRNNSLHTVTYQNTPRNVSNDKPVVPSDTKGTKNRTASSVRINIYKPSALAKKQKNAYFSTEKRKLFIEQYCKNAKVLQPKAVPNDLESIWHQTLTSRCVTENGTQDETERSKSSRQFSKSRLGLFATESSDIRFKTEETGTESYYEGNESDKKRGNLEETIYTATMRELQLFGALLKDFSKTMIYTQKSCQKAELKQRELYDFVNMFVIEIEELEKLHKEPRTGKLQNCLQSIEQRIEELSSEGDLLSEQMQQIKQISLSCKANQLSTSVSHSLSSNRKRQISINGAIYSQYPETSSPSEREKYILESSGSFSLTPRVIEQERNVRTAQSVRKETPNLKIDVEKVQSQELKQIMNKHKRIASAKPQKDAYHLAPLRPKKSYGDINTGPGRSLVHEKLSPQSNLIEHEISTADLPTMANEKVFYKKEDQGYFNRERKVKIDLYNEIKSGNKSWIPKFKIFEKVLEQVEERINKQICQLQIFKEEIDSEKETKQEENFSNKQIEWCFETVLSEVQEGLQSLETIRATFLEETLECLGGLDAANKSNSLKLKTLKNVVEASIQKIIQIDKHRKKYSRSDLMDKLLRQKYEKKNEKLKEDQQNYRKELDFLAQQVKQSLDSSAKDIPLSTLNGDLLRLIESYEEICKALYYLNRMPYLEREYNIQSKLAFRTSKKSQETVDRLKDFVSNTYIDIYPSFSEFEGTKDIVNNLNTKMMRLENEFKVITRIDLLSKCVEKPLMVSIKLVKRLTANYKELEQLLKKVQDEVIIGYNEVVINFMEAEKLVNTHMERFLKDRENLKFKEWRQNLKIIESLKNELDTLEAKVQEYGRKASLAKITLSPKPEMKNLEIRNIKKEVEAVIHILSIGKIFENNAFFSYFEGLKTYNLREKLGQFSIQIQEELLRQNAAKNKLEIMGTMGGFVVESGINFLTLLIRIFDKAFDLQEDVSREYLEFLEDNTGHESSIPQTMLLDQNRDKYPKLMSMVSFADEKINSEAIPSAQIDEQQEDLEIDENPNTKKEFAKKLLAMNYSKNEYPNKMSLFILRLKHILFGFIEHEIGIHIEKHVIFKEMFERFQGVFNQELDLLERVQAIIHYAQLNSIFFKKEMKPLMVLYRCLRIFQKSEEKVDSLIVARDWMVNTLRALKSLQEEDIARGGIETQVEKYVKTQENINISLDVISEIFALGSFFNEKKLKMYLGPDLRVDDMKIQEYIKIIKVEISNIKKRHKETFDLMDGDIYKQMEIVFDFIHNLFDLIKIAYTKYKNIYKMISEKNDKAKETTSEKNDKAKESFISYIEKIYFAVNELKETFFTKMKVVLDPMTHTTWVGTALEEFFKDVILKDLNLFKEIWENCHESDEFEREFQVEFIEAELKEKKQYTKLSESNPLKCNKKVDQAMKLEKSLTDLVNCREMIVRPELRETLVSKIKHIHGVKTVYKNFMIVYDIGRILNEKVVPILTETEISKLIPAIAGIEASVSEMIPVLTQVNQECKTLINEEKFEVNFSLLKVFREEILGFYINLKDWFRTLKINLQEINEFYENLEKKFANEILLLRTDWVLFVRGWVSTFAINVQKGLKPIDPIYQGFKTRMDVFVQGIQHRAFTKQSDIGKILEMVCCLNEKFIPARFFEFSREGRRVHDKISISIGKAIQKIVNERAKWWHIKRSLADISDSICECDKSMKYLDTHPSINVIFKNGIRDWNVLLEFYETMNMRTWLDLLNYVINELIIDPEDNVRRSEVRMKFPTLEGLCLFVAQETKCMLNNPKKELLKAIYEWLQHDSPKSN